MARRGSRADRSLGRNESMRLFTPRTMKGLVEAVDWPEVANLEVLRGHAAAWAKHVSAPSFKMFKEEETQRPFLDHIFRDALGYAAPESGDDFQFRHEQKAVTDATRADGGLGFFRVLSASKLSSDVRVVVEMKGPFTNLDAPQHGYKGKITPVQQAFGYAGKMGDKCRWVIVTNFVELRLYHREDQSRYVLFDLAQIDKEVEFKRLYALLANGRLFVEEEGLLSAVEKAHARRAEEDEQLSTEFYTEYKTARSKLFTALQDHNPERASLELLDLTQHLTDRVLFLCFCEDRHLLRGPTLAQQVQASRVALVGKKGFRLWEHLKGLFEALNTPDSGVNYFNGGLFAVNPALQSLVVPDAALETLIELGRFDFDSELGVTILGHCFEQSISDVESMRLSLQGKQAERHARQRQREGIYYTPSHITRYIVEGALGGWLDAQKDDLGLADLEPLSEADEASFGAKKPRKRVRKHIAFWVAYSARVRAVRVLDMACGSGAFLVAALERLRREVQLINAELARLRGGQMDFFEDIDASILGNNLFGVDVSSGAVDVARLSLWLETVTAEKPLTTLDENLRAGDSLIDDPSVVEGAFSWNRAFAEPFDVVIGNPPYDVLSEKETGLENIPERKAWFRAHPTLTRSFGGKQNLYKLFVCRMIEKLAPNGHFGFIVPMSLMGDLQATGVRQLMFEQCGLLTVDAFPQKDDPSRRVFRDAKLSTCIVVGRGGASDDAFQVRTHPGNRIDTPWDAGLSISAAQVRRYDAGNMVIPSCTREDWNVVERILEHPRFEHLGNRVTSFQGEVNETTVKKMGPVLTKDTDRPLILRGANLTRYAVRDASQGEVFYLDEQTFLSHSKGSKKARDSRKRRIGFQRSSPQNNFRRIIAAPIQRDLYCFDTVSYVTPDSSAVDLDCVLALLNSRIYDFWFRLTSTNSKVNAWQFNNLPFVLLEDSDTDATALIEDGQWAALVELLIEEGGAPRWVEVALAELARQMSVAESKRVLASRSERSKLSADAARLQRHADSLIGALFGLSQQQQRYVEERLKLML